MFEDKKKIITPIMIISILLLVLVVLIILKTTQKKSPITPSTQISREKTMSPSPANLSPSYKPARFLSSPTPQQLLYDYTVTQINLQRVIARNEKGDITITNDSRVKVFIGEPENAKPASFSDIKIGDTLILKRIPQQAAFVYIVNR
jgi:hypothetical protein